MSVDGKMVLTVALGMAAFGASIYLIRRYGNQVPVVGSALTTAANVATAS